MLVLLAVICAPVLSGCGGGEPAPASVESHGGLVGGIVAGLKQEDDEEEIKELAERETTKEEREEAHEQLEAEELEASQGEGPEVAEEG